MSCVPRSYGIIVLYSVIALSALTAPLLTCATCDLLGQGGLLERASEDNADRLVLAMSELLDDPTLPPTVDFVKPGALAFALSRDDVPQVAWCPSPPRRPPIL